MRSLPTLTEVVDAPPLPSAPAPAGDHDQAVLVERLLKQLEPVLEAQVEMQLQRAISDLVREQVQLLQPRIRQKVDAAARKAVTQAVAAELKLPPAAGK
jgi:hypothetical protein